MTSAAAVRRGLLSLALAAAVMAAALIVGARLASAHAVLVRSEPAGQSQLATAPSTIDLWVSEEVEPEFSGFELFASDGTELPLDGMRIDPADPRHLSALPRTLPPGVYTVVYHTLSRVDGHDWNGALTFTVLNPDGSAPSGGAFTPSLAGANSPALVSGRWLSFLGLSVLAGGAVVLAIATPGRVGEPLSRLASRRYRRLAVAGLVLAVAGTGLLLIDQRQSVGGSVTSILNHTRFGEIWLWRSLILLAMAVALGLGFLAERRGRDRIEGWMTTLVPGLALAGLLTMSLLSHAAAAPGSFWATVIDFVHLALAGLWVGGLATLAVLFLATRRDHRLGPALLPLMARFSVFAAAAVYMLAVTGVLRSFGELQSADEFVTSGYGRWLLVKLALLTPVLGVALFNRRRVHGWERAKGRRRRELPRALRRTLALETALVATVLLSVAFLGQTPPPRSTETAGSASSAIAVPYNQIAVVDDLTVHLQVTPATVGSNELRVHIYHGDGSAIGAVGSVQLTLSSAAVGGEGGDRVEAVPEEEGVYTATATTPALATDWSVTVDVRRPDHDDARADFSVPLAIAKQVSGAGALDSPVPQLSRNMLWALLLIMLGMGILLAQQTRPARGGRALGRGAGAAAVFAAVVLFVSAGHHGTSGSFVNPNPGDPASIQRGGELFATNCAVCHGVTGHGDGPGAVGLVPPPADLVIHVPLHQDGDLFAFISNGIVGTAMPQWSKTLTEQQRWDLVNYLRATFSEDATQ